MGMKIFASAIGYTAVTKSDTTAVTCKALYVGTGGTVVIAPSVGGTAVSFVNVENGQILPIELKSGTVNAATTASDIVALNW